MIWTPVIRWSLALILASAAHLVFLNLVPARTPPVQIEGGALQVQFGLDVSTVSARSGVRDENAQDDQSNPSAVSEPEPAPPSLQTPEPDVEPEPEESERDTEAVLQEPSDIAPDRSPEPEPRPSNSPAVEPVENTQLQEPETADSGHRLGLEAATDDLNQQPGAETSAPSDQASRADVDTQSESGTTKAGNSENTNYSGAVMQHLSRMRRPRASGPGSAHVRFTIAADGSLESLSIQSSSHSSRFDREALRMIERAQPFPTPPDGVNREFVVEIEGR